MGWRGVAAALLLLASLTARARAVEVPQAEIENRRCINCHGQSRMADLGPEERGPMVAAPKTPPSQAAPKTRPELYLSPGVLANSVHAKLACTDCHAQAKELPHEAKMPPATCNSTCHSRPNSEHLQGAHAAALAKGDPNAPTCATCHGGHDIVPKNQRQSRIYPLNVIKICGGCHAQHTGTDTGGMTGRSRVQDYLESVHGQAVSKGGLAVAATCADCHGNHLVLPAKDPRSRVNRQNVPQTCGMCHVGLSETYSQSIHGEKLAAGNPDAPVCTNCHTAHEISRTDTPKFKLDIVNECGDCHDKPVPGSNGKATLYETYRMSYHGQVTELGFTRGARCSDCHGAHDIRRIEDPKSRLNAQNRVQACQQCHKGATASFALFRPHADPRDSNRFPLLHYVWLYFMIMMSAAFGFFGLHCILWFIRSGIERVRHGRHPKQHETGTAIMRFNRVDRVNHAFVILSFFGLTVTGLPLLYADKEWAKTLASLLGGVRQAGLMHRFFAIMLIANFVIHGVGVVRRMKKHGPIKLIFGPTTMLPRPKDFSDCAGMFRWFFKGGKMPRFDRWTYWEKFDYIAEVGGSGIIGLSGLMLWFPEFFSRYLPGWMFNIATVVHGYEALLAIGFIFTIHFFNAHLRMDKFPVDDVMFTGRLSEEEFKHERPEEYDRLVATGQIDSVRVAPAPSSYRKFAVAGGILAMLIGTTLVVLIILAGMGWM